MIESTPLHTLHEHRLLEVLDHARRTVQMLSVVNDPWQTPLDAYATLADKIVMETALLILVTGRVPQAPPALVEASQALAAHLVPYIRSDRHRALLRRHPHAAVSLGMAHQALQEAGFPDAAFDALVADAFTSRQAQAAERLPYRHLEMLWLQTLRGQPPSTAAWAAAVQCSLLANEAHAVHMTADSVYALTHGLMYVTDFGQQALPPDVDQDGVTRMLDACLAWHAVSENLDLVGELLLGAVMTGTANTPPARFAWAVLNYTWAEFGFLPCPSFDLSTYLSLPDDERAAYAYVHTYHTTYVAGILSAVILTMDCRSLEWAEAPTRSAEAPSLTEPGTQLLAYQAELARIPIWPDVLVAGPLPPHDVATVLHDALLLMAAHDHRTDVLTKALNTPPPRRTPTFEAATNLLGRLTGKSLPDTVEPFPREALHHLGNSSRLHRAGLHQNQ
ncbi:DUF6895 family protein [Deinococcus depolymerans]|uniref:DUF6895 domain-containing protein n=1 Tax=Deinococcus depolymerans TaxID=392408 RepID=A0ABN1CCL9_9DEIO